MSVQNRQIGWNTEENLLYDILKQLDRLVQVAAGGGGGTGTVTSVSITSANGFAGSVATPTTTPNITISTSVTGLLKGDGVSISAAIAGTDYTTPAQAWLTSNGGTLTGPNTITGTTTNTIKYVFNSLAVTPVDGAGLWFANNTPAAAGVQQISPVRTLEGRGWKTDATAGSQSIKIRDYILPVEGTANALFSYKQEYSVNNVTYAPFFRIDYGELGLTINGQGNLTLGLESGQSLTTTNAYNNTLIGNHAGRALTQGYQNTVVGSRAAAVLTTGFQNTLLGQGAGNAITTQSANIHIGFHSGIRCFSEENVYIGNAVAQGTSTAANNTGGLNTAVGTGSMGGNSPGHSTGSENATFGRASLQLITTGSQNAVLGATAALSVTTGSGNTVVGYRAGFTDIGANTLTTGSNNTFLGFQSGLGSTTQRDKSVAIGYRAKVDANNVMALGGTGVDALNVGVGMTTPTARLHLPAGTVTAGTSPLKLTSGTNLTTPEAGSVEFDGTNYFVTSSTTRFTVAKVLTATATLNFDLTAVNSQDLTITVTGAASGDAVSLALDPASVAADITFFGWVSAANTVTVRCSRVGGGGAVDPASGTFRAVVFKLT